MRKLRTRLSNQKGFALVYMAALVATLILFSGLAVDAGRAYAVKVQLSKAVDGAALSAARHLNSGSPTAEATRIFNANFPGGYMGVSSISGPTVNVTTDAVNGRNIVDVTASAVMPTSFMRVGKIEQVTVASAAQATRRMVDLSIVLDVSSSIGSRWAAVRDATRLFISSFDAAHDRVALSTFGNGSKALYEMPSSRGFDKAAVVAAVPETLPGGSTLMVEGMYHGWDELRTVPSGQQASLRIIVLFTDGASNGVPAIYDAEPTGARSLRTWDFPDRNDPDGQTHDLPHIDGLYNTQTGVQGPTFSMTTNWDSRDTPPASSGMKYLPNNTTHRHRSIGIPTSFPLQTSSLKVNGSPQSSVRGLRDYDSAVNRYPAQVWNINNAARNVLEIIADAARSDAGDYKIRIYTIGMGNLVQLLLGTMPEKPETILKRIANDRTSPDFVSTQLEGKYFFAEKGSDVDPAYKAIQNEIIRLSK